MRITHNVISTGRSCRNSKQSLKSISLKFGLKNRRLQDAHIKQVFAFISFYLYNAVLFSRTTLLDQATRPL